MNYDPQFLSEQDKIMILEYLSKQTSIQEIAIAIDKKHSQIKHHINLVATEDILDNGLKEEEVCKSYTDVLSMSVDVLTSIVGLLIVS